MRFRLAAFFTVAAFATVLSACGGGGGGSLPPSGGGGTSATPTPTPVPTPTLAPQTESTTGPVTTAAGSSLSLGAVSNGSATVVTSASVTLPALSASGTATAVLSGAVPTGDPLPQRTNLKGRYTLGVPNTPLAYITLTFAQSEMVNSSPAIAVVFPSNVTITSGNAYLVIYTGGTWNEVAGPITVGSSNTITFPSTTVSPAFTFAANTAYTFAVITTGSLTIATPTPVPTSAPTPSSGTTARPTQNPTPANNGAVIAGPSFAPASPGFLGGYGPGLIANTFQYPVQSGYNGSGQTVATVIDYSYAASDLTAYLAEFGITQSGTVTSEDVQGGAGSDTAAQGEATLDIETISGLAPGANVIQYLVPSLNGMYATDAYEQILTEGKANVVNSSFGGCEYVNMTGEDTVLAEGAAQGVAFFASSGDQGNECYNGTGFVAGVNYPASDPNVIGVGGNETYPLSSRPFVNLLNPVAWNDTKCGTSAQNPTGQCATGGGVSGSWQLPSFQQGLAGVASTSLRNVPDIAFPAEYTGTYFNGAWVISDGTSWSSPLAAAMMAEVYEYCGGGTFVYPVAMFYSVHASAPSDFFAITSGNNQFGSTTPSYSASSSGGYNNTTGLGVPYGYPFAQKACVNRVNPSAAHRNAGSIVVIAERGSATARSVDLTPHVGGLTDLGRRTSIAQTRIQLVMRPTSTIAQDEAAAVAVLQANGFTIVQRYPNHLVVDAQGPSSAIESLFSAQMHDVSQGMYGTKYMPVGAAVIPASLNAIVAGVTLDDVVVAFTGPARASGMLRL